MKLEISQKGGTTHEVELPGSVVVIGRDPGCDVVLNDPKCSRRHAVLEEGPDGVLVRDPGSANGITVNGRRVERARLQPGDALRVGDTVLTLLAEIGETVVMAPDDLDLRTMVGAPRPSAPAPAPAPAPRPPAQPPLPPTAPRGAVPPGLPRRSVSAAAAPPSRPATVSVLAGLWALFVPASVAASLYAAQLLGGGVLAWSLGAIASLLLAGLGTAMAFGLSRLAPWARHLQVATAAVGLVLCPFTLASATVLLYMMRPEVKAAFEGGARPGNGSADATFALSLVGMLALGAALTAIAALLL